MRTAMKSYEMSPKREIILSITNVYCITHENLRGGGGGDSSPRAVIGLISADDQNLVSYFLSQAMPARPIGTGRWTGLSPLNRTYVLFCIFHIFLIFHIYYFPISEQLIHKNSTPYFHHRLGYSRQATNNNSEDNWQANGGIPLAERHTDGAVFYV